MSETASAYARGQGSSDDGDPAGTMYDPIPTGGASLDELDISSLIGFKLRTAQEAVFRAFEQAANDPDLKPRRFTALCFLAQRPGMSQSDLGALVGRDKSTITPMISDLIESGHVRREQTPGDRRSFSLYLTERGEMLLQQQWRIAKAHEARLEAVIGSAEKTQFMAQLDRLILALS